MGKPDQVLAHVLAGIAGWAMIVFVLRDAFETMILPRRLNGRFRFTRVYYQSIWPVWSALAVRLRGRRRESALSLFGPLSMLLLFVLWAASLIVGFAALYWGFGTSLQPGAPPSGFGADLFLSGDTIFTLGSAVAYGGWGRLLVVCEGGLGLGFVAIIISYLPVLYGGFSRRETSISMLDARAGSPPSASELLRRHAGALDELQTYLAEWERWSAELLESQISYPVLGYFRSQHVNQSWLAALGTVLDACAMLLACSDEHCTRQAQLTFAIARHAVVDLAQIFIHQLPGTVPDRLPDADLAQLEMVLAEAGMPLRWEAANLRQLAALRQLYEPHVLGIATHLKLEPPRWVGNPNSPDNWQRSPWDRFATGATGRVERGAADRHY